MMRRISKKLALAFVSAALALGFSLPAHAQTLSAFNIGASPNPVGDGFYTTLSGFVLGNGENTPNGSIDFYISSDQTACSSDQDDIGTVAVNTSGIATISYYANQPGTIPICATYGNDTYYAGATAGPFVLTVYSPTSILVYVPGASVPGATVTFNVVLTQPSGQPAPTGTITLEDPGNDDTVVGGPTTVSTITVNGQSVLGATISTAALTSNQYLAVYSGDGNYEPESAQGTIFLENPLTSISPASFLAGAAISSPYTSCTTSGSAPGPGLQVTLTGIGFNADTTATIQGQSLQVSQSTTNPTTQLIGCIPTSLLASPATLSVETNTAGQTGGPVAFQVYAPYSVNTAVSSNPATFAYGSNLSALFSGTAARTAATDAAVPAGTVTFGLTGTNPVSPLVTLGTGQLTQGTAAGAYQSPLMAPFDTNSTQKMIVADLNGDGYVDVVGMPGSNFGSPAAAPYLQVFLSTGANAFQTEQQVYSGCAAQDFAVGDINGDGKPDLVVVCPGVSTPGFNNPLQAYYMLGNGDGSFKAPVAFGNQSYVSSPTQVVLGWFNNDGYNDIAVIDGVNGYLQIISPTPNTYDNYVYFDTGYGPVFSAGAADFNQDGLTDIVLAEYTLGDGTGSGAVLPLINSGSGNSFNALNPTQFSATTYFMWNMTVTDVNGDGYPDVAIADPGYQESSDTGNVLIFENDQTGNLPLTETYPLNSVGAVAGAPFPIIGQPPSNAAAAPGWNLVYSAYGSNGDTWVGELQRQNATTWTLVNTADTGTFQNGTDFGASPGFIVAGDMNGDGYLDFAATGLIGDDSAPSGTLDELVPYYYGNDAQVTLSNTSQLPTPGTYSLSMTYPGNQLYQANNTATTQITITQATPTITWATPAAITYGTALSATQLDATASAPGTFTYSPAAGTVLGEGANQLTVTFTPTDTADYTTANGSVTIQVTQATPTITWGAPAAITYGTVLSATQLDATASTPGTLTYTPAAGTTLTAGSHTLGVSFTPTDTTDYTTAPGPSPSR